MPKDDLEERTKTEETRTLPDGSELKLEIYPLNQESRRILGVKKGRLILEKVLSVRLQKFGCPLLLRVSSPRKSWDIPEEIYWGIFRNSTSYREVEKIILDINLNCYS